MFRPPQSIHTLENNGVQHTDPDEITEIMQNWYQNTANTIDEQTLTLDEFVQQNNIILPQLSQDQKNELEDEFSVDEIKTALKAAAENSASGPTGPSIAFYTLLFMLIPDIMTNALNQLTYVPGLSDLPELTWIQSRKIVYIPKKNPAITPSDFCPLSMLEVLYKIPSRIIAAIINKILPTIIGPHQHGFMSGKSIQDPIIIATSLIQDATINQKPLQLVSLTWKRHLIKHPTKLLNSRLEPLGFRN